MNITFKKSVLEEAGMLIKIYNQAFYDDYIRFNGCPGYGHTLEEMQKSILENNKFIIYADNNPVGVISVSDKSNGSYHVGCLCVIPEYQHKGIGTKAVQFIKQMFHDWNEITLETPAEKKENVEFYTKKCGFHIIGTIMDGKTKLYCFIIIFY